MKSDPQIGVSVESGDRIVGAGFKDSNGKYATVTLDASGNIPVASTFTPSGTQDVNVTKIGGNAVTTTLPVSQATGTNLHTVVDSGTITTVSTVTAVTTVSTVTAVTAITNALPTGTNTIGNVTPIPGTSGGLVTANFTSGDSFTALTATAQVIKASAGQLFGWYIYNPNTSATYVIIYNTAQASVTVGTTNPLIVLCIPASSAANCSFEHGIAFSNAGWSIAATTTGGGNTAPSTALECMIWYK